MAKSALKKPSPAKKNVKRQGASGRTLAKKTSKSVAAKPKSKLPVKSAKAKSPPVKTVRPAKPAKERATSAMPADPAQTAPMNRVATNLKPHKNQAGLSVRELEHFRDLLLEKRREIVGDMSSMEREALRSGSGSNLSTLPLHMADMGTDNYEQEFTLGLVEKDRNLLRDLNHALAKIQNGTYGLCEGTGKPIAKARLEVQPWARYGIEYARKVELGGAGVR